MRRYFLKTLFMTLVAVFVMGGPAGAAGKERISPICAGCHKNEVDTIRGLVKSGSQGEDSFVVQAGKDVWNVRYDKGTKLNKFESVRQLGNEEAVLVKVREKDGTVYAEAISYKPNYDFISADMVIELDELAALLKKDPQQANYAVFDVRGVADYQEGHLPGAITFPFYRFNHFKDRLPKDKNTTIITYCNSYG
ncbi:MAG: rhodanese-like domain-containing protein [Nitrospirae bacterium]|nr:MAG: rhodanese-like domain-containing protein [Nitrospirota bacterium]